MTLFLSLVHNVCIIDDSQSLVCLIHAVLNSLVFYIIVFETCFSKLTDYTVLSGQQVSGILQSTPSQ